MRFSCKRKAFDFKQSLYILLIVGAAVILLYSFGGELVRRYNHKMIDFKQFYYAAVAIVSHTNIYQSWHCGYIYPPLLALLFVPFTVFPLMTSIALWGGLNVLLTLCILWGAVKTITQTFKVELTALQIAGICSLAILLNYDPIRWEILLGQTDSLILLGITFALYWVKRKPFLAGLLLGAAVNIKYNALFILPLLILRCRWRVLAGLVAGIMFCAILPALMVGWKTNIFYLETALRGMLGMIDPQFGPAGIVAQVPKLEYGRNITITSGIYRLFKTQGLTNLDAMLTVLTLMALTSVILLRIFRHYGVTIWDRSQQSPSIFLLEWYALYGCMIIFSPQNTMRHLYLFLTPQLLAAFFLMIPKPDVKKWPLLLAILFVQIGWSIDNPSWIFIGGPCWSLLPLIIILTATGLRFSRDFQRATPGVVVGGAVNITGQVNSLQ